MKGWTITKNKVAILTLQMLIDLKVSLINKKLTKIICVISQKSGLVKLKLKITILYILCGQKFSMCFR